MKFILLAAVFTALPIAAEAQSAATPPPSMREQIKADRAKAADDDKSAATSRPWDRDINGRRPWDRPIGPK